VRVLILGSGGREHAMGWAFARAGHEVFFAPGNGGTSRDGRNLDPGGDLLGFLRGSLDLFDLVVPGPEDVIASGVADVGGKKVFAPLKDAARLESSKAFAKGFMERHGIPTAPFVVVEDPAGLPEAMDRFGPPYVLKADPLAGGKGVLVLEDRGEALEKGARLMRGELLRGVSGALVVEQFLPGEELSAICVVGDRGFALLPFARDYKRAFDGDRGPNTGGMGCWAPVRMEPGLVARVEEIVDRTLFGLRRDGKSYRGFLYVGLMLTEEGPKVLEYNVRMGDPETEVIVPLDPLAFVESVISANFEGRPSRSPSPSGFAVDVVVASEGYPLSPRRGQRVMVPEEGLYFFAGVERGEEGLSVSGGRVVNCVGLGDSLEEARAEAYELAAEVKGDGLFYRKDIALFRR